MHIWMRAETRPNERRTALLPDGAAQLLAQGHKVTVEDSKTRVVPASEYMAVGCRIAPEGSWRDAPPEAIILGLKELPEDGTPLRHRHIMFGHAFKGQPAGQVLLDRFRAGGGTLLDLEYLVDETGRRVAAFGYWAGYAGAALTLRALAGHTGPVDVYASAKAMAHDVRGALGGASPSALIIGALGRVGTGAAGYATRLASRSPNGTCPKRPMAAPFPRF